MTTTTIPIGRNGLYGRIDVDRDRFTPEVQEYIFDYGLRQCLNDAAAAKELVDKDGKTIRRLTDEEILAKVERRLEALYSGSLRTSRITDPFAAECRRLAIARLTAAYKPGMRDIPTNVKGPHNRLMYVVNRDRARSGKASLTLEEAVAGIMNGPQGDVIRRLAREAIDMATDLDVSDDLGL